VVISGAEQAIQSLWGLNAATRGLAMSMALWGTMLGALFGCWPTDHFGRRRTSRRGLENFGEDERRRAT
jgi:MFS family permease